jgi:hypothetical protein
MSGLVACLATDLLLQLLQLLLLLLHECRLQGL